MENWKPIVTYEGLYEVSDEGRIRSVRVSRNTWVGRVLVQHRIPLYLGIALSKNNVRKTYTVHRLVARAFLGPCPEGYQVNHKDGDKLNNHTSNLEYVTCAENQAHGRRLGLMHKARGEEHGRATLTEAKVRRLRTMHAQGLRNYEIARRLGMTQFHVSKVLHGVLWSHVR